MSSIAKKLMMASAGGGGGFFFTMIYDSANTPLLAKISLDTGAITEQVNLNTTSFGAFINLEAIVVSDDGQYIYGTAQGRTELFKFSTTPLAYISSCSGGKADANFTANLLYYNDFVYSCQEVTGTHINYVMKVDAIAMVNVATTYNSGQNVDIMANGTGDVCIAKGHLDRGWNGFDFVEGSNTDVIFTYSYSSQYYPYGGGYSGGYWFYSSYSYIYYLQDGTTNYSSFYHPDGAAMVFKSGDIASNGYLYTRKQSSGSIDRIDLANKGGVVSYTVDAIYLPTARYFIKVFVVDDDNVYGVLEPGGGFPVQLFKLEGSSLNYVGDIGTTSFYGIKRDCTISPTPTSLREV